MQMNWRKFARVLILLIYCTYRVQAQISPLFHLPSLNYDLPVFNPAFTGDTDRYRINYIITSNKPAVGGLGNNISNLLSVDAKTPLNKSSILITYGASMLYNQVDIISDLSNAHLNYSLDNLQFTYGAAEVTFGGRMPTRFERSIRQKGYVSNPDVKNKQNRRKSDSKRKFVNPEQWKFCSYNSAQDYVAFNMALGYTFTALRNVDNGMILNDQIMANAIVNGVTADPFSINSMTSDPLIGEHLLNPANSLYFGFGLLYHYSMTANSSLRMSYGMKNVLRTYLSVPESDQRISPLKHMQIRYTGLLNNMGVNMALMYLDQNPKLFPQPGQPVNQLRFNMGPTFYANYIDNRYVRGFHWMSIDPGITVMWFNNMVSVISTQVGMSFKSNLNFNHGLTSRSGRNNNRRNYSGNVWHVFLGYDFHTSSAMSHRDTYGNFRLGIKVEAWN